MDNRIRSFTGIYNFRDYGGYAVAGSGRLRTGLLWRSGQHFEATPADLNDFATAGISTIFDLRGNGERERFPCPRAPGFAPEVLFADGETAAAAIAPHLHASRTASTAADVHQAMVSLNENMPFRPFLVEIITRYLHRLADGDAPSLVHCVAGKDRTGLAVALFHLLTGVHEDDAMADYLLTNTASNIDARIAAGTPTIRDLFGADRDVETVRALMGVHQDYLATALRVIREGHGDVHGYARDVLGMDAAKVAALRDRWVV